MNVGLNMPWVGVEIYETRASQYITPDNHY